MKNTYSHIFLAFFISLFFNPSGFSQKNIRVPVSLDWFKKELTIYNGVESKTVYTFKNGKINSTLPQITNFIYTFDLKEFSNLEIELQNVKVDNPSLEYYSQVTNNEFEINSVVNTFRNEFIGQINLTPVRIVDGIVERITSCNIVITHNTLDAKGVNQKRGPNRTFNSVLETGSIYKLGIEKSGVYKLNKAQLSDLGLDVNNIDPRKISIYTNKGGMLPEKISDQNPDDLIEIPILIEGENDGSFDANDNVYFYAEGADKWEITENNFKFVKNIYDTRNFAFLKINTNNGKRIQNSTSELTPEFIASNYDEFQVYEEDNVNLLGSNSSTEGSGKKWFGEKLAHTEVIDLRAKFNFDKIDNRNISIKGQFASRSGNSTNTVLTVGDTEFKTNYGTVSLGLVESEYARLRPFSHTSTFSSTDQLLFTYNAPNGGEGWLDYVNINYKKSMRLSNEQVTLRNFEHFEYIEFGYDISNNDNDILYWNVSNLEDLHGILPANGLLVFKTNNELQSIVAFKKENALSPEIIGEIDNQNIHSIDDVDMIVLYHNDFKEAVDKFINHRATHSGYEVLGIEISKIYPEFSSGRQDPTAIRDFVKMVHDRSDRFKYLLLFGDGSYDQRGLLNIPDHRFIPVYETDESLNPIRAFPTDDYYALLSDNEGVGLDGALDIAVGRLTVTTLDEANAVVNKIIQYDTSPLRFGDWKLRTTYTADDEDSNTHLNQIDGIANMVTKDFSIMNDQKLYFDAYRQETTPGGQRYPDVEDAFERAMDRGHLTFCYLGHGGPKGWAQERVLKVADIQEWDNINNQTLIISATCSFTGYDDPEVKSAGEYALLNSKGGAVALFTTVRAVYASENERLTRAVFENIYKKDEEGYPLTFGEAIIKAKNTNSQDTIGENSRKFSMIGDPSQRIALPFYNVTVEQINDINVGEFTDTLGALEIVKVAGSITDKDGAVISDFNGKVYPTIFDKRTIIETLGNDAKSPVTKVDVMKNIIFKGIASVVNGKYEFSFVVPKDINYSIGKGKISLYATDNVALDAGGAFSDIIIGGSGNDIVDDEGPIISAYLNDNSFENYDVVGPDPILFIDLSDDLGINVTGTSIGHDLTAKLTGPLNKSYVLNEFYEASLDDFKAGKVIYPLNDLPLGKYEMTIKAWDISNNSASTTIFFEVKENKDKSLFNVINFPNPFDIGTDFAFSHDLGSTDAIVSVQIFSIQGGFVGELSKSTFLVGGREEISFWEPGSDFGLKLDTGMYLYKIKVESTSLGISRESKFKKMIKI